jgi:hypothetical protein
MAQRPAWPAALATGWRSRPGVVRVAAALFGLFGLLLVAIEAGEGRLGVAVVVTGLVLLASAAALVWAGRLGYWLALAVAALVALLLVVALTRDPEVAGVVVTAVGALPLVLLLAPAARWPRRSARAPRSSPAGKDPPQAWARSFAGWGQFALMLAVGGLLSVAGLVMALTGQGAERGAGAAIALFFLACLLTAPLFAPGRRRGRPRLETLRVGDRHELGILVPYSAWRTVMLLAAIACLALAMLGFVVFADAFADGPGEPLWPLRLLGAFGAAFFGLGGVMVARRGWGRRWRMLLSPSALIIAAGGAHTVVPWDAIQRVRATEVRSYVGGVRVGEPLVGIDVSDPQAIQTGRLGRLLLPLNRRLAADLALPVRTMDLDPQLLVAALRYYRQHPQARAELATDAGLARLQDGRFI